MVTTIHLLPLKYLFVTLLRRNMTLSGDSPIVDYLWFILKAICPLTVYHTLKHSGQDNTMDLKDHWMWPLMENQGEAFRPLLYIWFLRKFNAIFNVISHYLWIYFQSNMSTNITIHYNIIPPFVVVRSLLYNGVKRKLI